MINTSAKNTHTHHTRSKTKKYQTNKRCSIHSYNINDGLHHVSQRATKHETKTLMTILTISMRYTVIMTLSYKSNTVQTNIFNV